MPVLEWTESSTCTFNKNKLYKVSDCWVRDVMFNFNFLEKSLGLVSTVNFVYDFQMKNICHILFNLILNFTESCKSFKIKP